MEFDKLPPLSNVSDVETTQRINMQNPSDSGVEAETDSGQEVMIPTARQENIHGILMDVYRDARTGEERYLPADQPAASELTTTQPIAPQPDTIYRVRDLHVFTDPHSGNERVELGNISGDAHEVSHLLGRILGQPIPNQMPMGQHFDPYAVHPGFIPPTYGYPTGETSAEHYAAPSNLDALMEDAGDQGHSRRLRIPRLPRAAVTYTPSVRAKRIAISLLAFTAGLTLPVMAVDKMENKNSSLMDNVGSVPRVYQSGFDFITGHL